jgi:hypothetical protein
MPRNGVSDVQPHVSFPCDFGERIILNLVSGIMRTIGSMWVLHACSGPMNVISKKVKTGNVGKRNLEFFELEYSGC